MIRVIPSRYSKKGEFGDFKFMITLPEFTNSLFIFNDNYEQHKTTVVGHGNAVMREYNRYSNLSIPRSAGIPTGSINKGGFESLDELAKNYIDESIDEITVLLQSGKYDSVVFSADKDNNLSTSIFKIGDDVREYITSKIYKLGEINIATNNTFGNHVETAYSAEEEHEEDPDEESENVNEEDIPIMQNHPTFGNFNDENINIKDTDNEETAIPDFFEEEDEDNTTCLDGSPYAKDPAEFLKMLGFTGKIDDDILEKISKNKEELYKITLGEEKANQVINQFNALNAIIDNIPENYKDGDNHDVSSEELEKLENAINALNIGKQAELSV